MPSFVEDLQAAVDALGISEPGMLMGIALTEWGDEQTRDAFLAQLTQKG